METSVYYDEIDSLVKDIDVDLKDSFDTEFNNLITKYRTKKERKKETEAEKLARFESYFGANKNDVLSSDELIAEIKSMSKDNDDEILKLIGVND